MEIVEEKKRFVLLNDEQKEIGEMTWSDAGANLMIIDHTFVEPEYRGQNLAERLVIRGVDKARKEGKQIVPLCPFVRRQFEEKSEYKDVWHR
jgi:predicted GNAT family acetyltransferase